MRRTIASLTVIAALLTLLAPTALAGGAGAAQYPLYPGWDTFTQPLTMGKVVLNSPDTTGKLGVTFVLSGATPNPESTDRRGLPGCWNEESGAR